MSFVAKEDSRSHAGLYETMILSVLIRVLKACFVEAGNLGQTFATSASSGGSFDLSPTKLFWDLILTGFRPWCTHLAHFLCKSLLFSCFKHV